jgi:hypothetical protein
MKLFDFSLAPSTLARKIAQAIIAGYNHSEYLSRKEHRYSIPSRDNSSGENAHQTSSFAQENNAKPISDRPHHQALLFLWCCQ